MTPGWRRGGGDDRDNDGGDDGGRDADDSYFCVLRGGCGGAETTVAAAAGMCCTGELKHTHTCMRNAKVHGGSGGGAVTPVSGRSLVVAHYMWKCPWARC